VLLLTGQQDGGVYRFYEQAGFKMGVKTSFLALSEVYWHH
jgi:hypothetical protein